MLIALLLGVFVLLAPRLQRRTSDSEPGSELIFETVATELRRGASLRAAIAAAVPASRTARLATTGQPMPEVAAELVALLSPRTHLIDGALELAATTGAPSAQLFDLLAERSRNERRLAARRRVVTAQARLSAIVVAVLPLALGILLMATRSADVVASSSAAQLAVAVGLLLQILGASVVALLLRSAQR